MNTLMQFLQTTFSPLVLIFTVANLAAMGLQVRVPEVAVALRNRKALALILVWGWVLGPAFGYLITRVLPLEEPYVVVVLLASLAPCAPFLQQMVGKARGDMGFAGALIPTRGGGHSGIDALDGAAVDQGTDDQHLVARQTAPPDHPPAAGAGAAIRHYADTGGNQDLPGGQGAGPALHIADDRCGAW